MQKTRFTEEQMVTILREADQRPVPEVAKKHGVSSQTIYAWRKHFGSLEPTDIKRLRQLEQENGRLKKMVADRDLEIDVLKEITRKNSRRTPAPAAGRVCALARAVRPPGVRRARRRPVDTRLPIASGGPGCPAAGRHASAGGAVSALRISPDSNLLETGGPRDEPGPHASTLAPGGAASAPASAAPAGSQPSGTTKRDASRDQASRRQRRSGGARQGEAEAVHCEGPVRSVR